MNPLCKSSSQTENCFLCSQIPTATLVLQNTCQCSNLNQIPTFEGCISPPTDQFFTDKIGSYQPISNCQIGLFALPGAGCVSCVGPSYLQNQISRTCQCKFNAIAQELCLKCPFGMKKVEFEGQFQGCKSCSQSLKTPFSDEIYCQNCPDKLKKRSSSCICAQGSLYIGGKCQLCLELGLTSKCKCNGRELPIVMGDKAICRTCTGKKAVYDDIFSNNQVKACVEQSMGLDQQNNAISVVCEGKITKNNICSCGGNQAQKDGKCVNFEVIGKERCSTWVVGSQPFCVVTELLLWWEILLIVIGVLAAISLIVVIVWFIIKKKKSSPNKIKHSNYTVYSYDNPDQPADQRFFDAI